MSTIEILKELGFNSYEIDSYLFILEKGICEAKEITKNTNVPFGKIYSVLSNLVDKGLIEMQNTRPKKFKALEPKSGLKKIYEEKKQKHMSEIDNLHSNIKELEKTLVVKNKNKKEKESIFWTTTLGTDEIVKTLYNIFSEAEDEVCIVLNKCKEKKEHQKIESQLIKLTPKMINHGVYFRIIHYDKEFDNRLNSVLDVMEDKTFAKKIKRNTKIKHLDTDKQYIIVDDKMVIVYINHPAKIYKPIGLVKMYDENFTKEVKRDFNKLWKS